ncbi:hypothetical protein ACN47E_000155 [Coniothyrium glycines]
MSDTDDEEVGGYNILIVQQIAQGQGRSSPQHLDDYLSSPSDEFDTESDDSYDSELDDIEYLNEQLNDDRDYTTEISSENEALHEAMKGDRECEAYDQDGLGTHVEFENDRFEYENRINELERALDSAREECDGHAGLRERLEDTIRDKEAAEETIQDQHNREASWALRHAEQQQLIEDLTNETRKLGETRTELEEQLSDAKARQAEESQARQSESEAHKAQLAALAAQLDLKKIECADSVRRAQDEAAVHRKDREEWQVRTRDLTDTIAFQKSDHELAKSDWETTTQQLYRDLGMARATQVRLMGVQQGQVNVLLRNIVQHVEDLDYPLRIKVAKLETDVMRSRDERAYETSQLEFVNEILRQQIANHEREIRGLHDSAEAQQTRTEAQNMAYEQTISECRAYVSCLLKKRFSLARQAERLREQLRRERSGYTGGILALFEAMQAYQTSHVAMRAREHDQLLTDIRIRETTLEMELVRSQNTVKEQKVKLFEAKQNEKAQNQSQINTQTRETALRTQLEQSLVDMAVKGKELVDANKLNTNLKTELEEARGIAQSYKQIRRIILSSLNNELGLTPKWSDDPELAQDEVQLPEKSVLASIALNTQLRIETMVRHIQMAKQEHDRVKIELEELNEKHNKHVTEAHADLKAAKDDFERRLSALQEKNNYVESMKTQLEERLIETESEFETVQAYTIDLEETMAGLVERGEAMLAKVQRDTAGYQDTIVRLKDVNSKLRTGAERLCCNYKKDYADWLEVAKVSINNAKASAETIKVQRETIVAMRDFILRKYPNYTFPGRL